MNRRCAECRWRVAARAGRRASASQHASRQLRARPQQSLGKGEVEKEQPRTAILLARQQHSASQPGWILPTPTSKRSPRVHHAFSSRASLESLPRTSNPRARTDSRQPRGSIAPPCAPLCDCFRDDIIFVCSAMLACVARACGGVCTVAALPCVLCACGACARRAAEAAARRPASAPRARPSAAAVVGRAVYGYGEPLRPKIEN